MFSTGRSRRGLRLVSNFTRRLLATTATVAAWFASATLVAADTTKPMVLADFNQDRYALPDVGPNLLTNGDFPTGTTGWELATGGGGFISHSAGRLQMNRTSNICSAYQLVPLTPGKTYRVRATQRMVSGSTQPNIAFRVGPAAADTVFLSGTVGTVNTDVVNEFYINAPVQPLYLHLIGGTNNGVCEFDDVSVCEVLLGTVGPELLVNGGFDDDSVWTLDVGGGTGTVVISGGQLTLTGDGTNFSMAEQAIATEIGKTYTICFKQTGNVSGLGQILIGTTLGASDVASYNLPTTGNWHQLQFAAESTTSYLRIQRRGTSALNIDDVSLRSFTPDPVLRSATFAEVFKFQATSAGSARTYIGSDGLLKDDIGADQPRFNYRDKRRLLLEKDRQNITLNINEFSSSWTYVSTTVGINGTMLTADPANGNNAGRMEEGAGSGQAFAMIKTIGKDNTVRSYVASIYMKQAGRRYVYLCMDDTTFGNRGYAVFDLQTGAVMQTGAAGGYSGTVAWMEPAANGFWRCCICTTTNTSTNLRFVIISTSTGTGHTNQSPTVTGLSGGAYYLYGFQFEQALYPSSLIKTSGASVTRAIETCEFSPFVVTLFNRGGGTAITRVGINRASQVAATTVRYTWLGGGGTTGLVSRGSSAQIVTSYNGTNSLNRSLTGGSGVMNAAFGSAIGWNGGGRRFSFGNNPGNVESATDVYLIGSLTTAYLGRRGTAFDEINYGAGEYDFFALYPIKISLPSHEAFAVAA